MAQKDRPDARRILTMRDFRRIKELKAQQGRHGFAGKRKREGEREDASHVEPEDLAGLADRRRRSKAERLEAVRAGREKSDAIKKTHGLTNREQKKGKDYLMLSRSRDVIHKQKQSLKAVKGRLTKHLKTLGKTTKLASKIRKRKGRG